MGKHNYPIVCLDDGKVYYTSEGYMSGSWCKTIFIHDEFGNYAGCFNKDRFITMAEYRDKRINEILE